VLLDESVAGLDPVTQRWMWKFIPDNTTGRTVLLTTNVMDEAESLCNRIGIMANHQMRCIRTPEELKSRYVHGYSLLSSRKRKVRGGHRGTDQGKIENAFPGSDILEIRVS